MKNKLITTILVISPILFFNNPAFSSESQYIWVKQTDKNFEKADTQMNKTYNQVLKKYAKDKDFISKLRTAQLAWIKYRDAHLDSIYPKKDKTLNYGSVYPTCYALMLTQMTELRTAQLNQWVTGMEEGEVCSGSR